MGVFNPHTQVFETKKLTVSIHTPTWEENQSNLLLQPKVLPAERDFTGVVVPDVTE